MMMMTTMKLMIMFACNSSRSFCTVHCFDGGMMMRVWLHWNGNVRPGARAQRHQFPHSVRAECFRRTKRIKAGKTETGQCPERCVCLLIDRNRERGQRSQKHARAFNDVRGGRDVPVRDAPRKSQNAESARGMRNNNDAYDSRSAGYADVVHESPALCHAGILHGASFAATKTFDYTSIGWLIVILFEHGHITICAYSSALWRTCQQAESSNMRGATQLTILMKCRAVQNCTPKTALAAMTAQWVDALLYVWEATKYIPTIL